MGRLITFDLESFPTKPGLAAPRPVVAGLKVDDEPTCLFAMWVKEDWTKFSEYFYTDSLFCGHNVAFDFSLLAAWGYLPIHHVFKLYRENKVRDTMVRQKLLDIKAGRKQENGYTLVLENGEWVKRSYSLAALETKYTGKDRSADKKAEDAWRLRYGTLFGVPLAEWPEDASRYVIEDVDATYNVFKSQPEEVVDETRQVFKAWSLRLTSCWGVRTDGDRVTSLDAKVNAICSQLEEKMLQEGLYKWAGPKKKPKLSKNMAAIRARAIKAYETLGEPAPMTDKGNVKTDADSLKHSGDELLSELGGGGPLNTVRNTFLPLLKQGTEHPINTKFDELKNTGRTSSYEPNLANIPRSLGVRECFVARPGHVFCSVDWAAAELRALAQICLWMGFDSEMAKTFKADKKADPHQKLAASLLKVTPEVFADLKKAGDARVKKARQDAKAANFGYPGGMREKRFVSQARKQGMNFSPEEATALRNAWLETTPEMYAYLNWGSMLSQRARRNGTYNTITQWAPWVKDEKPHRMRGGLEYSDLLNTGFQGLVSDAFCDALNEISFKCYCDPSSAMYGGRVIFALYDETVCEWPEERAHEAALEQTEIMNKWLDFWCPDVPAYSEPALMKHWYKEAEAVYDREGRLVSWTP